jgi:hypothetical protein
MHVSRLAVILCGLASAASWRLAARTRPAPPVVTPPAGSKPSTARNGSAGISAPRTLPSSQRSATSCTSDGTRTPLTAVTCATQASAAGFACSARPAGDVSRISYAADRVARHRRHRARERAFGVAQRVRGAADQRGVAGRATRRRRRPRRGSGTSRASSWRTASRCAWNWSPRASKNLPILAFAPDGRLLVAEPRGHDSHLSPDERARRPARSCAVAGQEFGQGEAPILAIALDPEFDRTRFVFAIYAATVHGPANRVFTLARFR